MLIKVMYQNNEYGMVNPFLLDKLIASGKIKKFLRSEGWATIGIDPIRGTGGHYKGSERRIELLKDEDKTKEQLIHEMKELRQQIAELARVKAQHNQAEEALRMNEEKYRTVADFTYDWEDWLGPHGKYIYVSPSCEWITGYRPDEFVSDPDLVIKITHPDDRDLVEEHFREILRGSIAIHNIDFRIITRSGEVRWISHYCQPVYSKDGNFLGSRSSSRDITQRKKIEEELKQLTNELERFNVELSTANEQLKKEMEVRVTTEKALKESEERYKRMVSAVTAYTYSVDLSHAGAISTRHSMGCIPVTGYNPEDFEADPYLWHSMIHPDDRMMVENSLKEILAGHEVSPIEHRIIRRDGKVVWVRNTMAPYYDGDGRLIRYDGLIEDITERKQAEEALRIKDNAIESSINGIGIADLKGCLIYANKSFLKMWGYDEKEAQGTHIENFCHIKEEFAKVIEALKDKGGWIGELKAKRKDGSSFDVDFSASMVTDEAGKPICMMASFIDITERRQTAEELKKLSEELARSNIDLRDFAYVASHDLKKPLQSIDGFVKLLARRYKGKLDAKADELIEYIGSGVKRMQELIKDLLEYSQIEAKEKNSSLLIAQVLWKRQLAICRQPSRRVML